MNHPMYYVQTEIQKIKPFLLQAYLKLCLKAKGYVLVESENFTE